jgi:hypothetical protein
METLRPILDRRNSTSKPSLVLRFTGFETMPNQNQSTDNSSPIHEIQPVTEAIAQLKFLRVSMRLNGLSVQELRGEGRR